MDNEYISFGINPNNRVIMWYGDLIQLSSKEQSFIKPHNIQSDHNIDSEFYDAQIDIAYTDPIIEVQILRLIQEINERCDKQFGVRPFLYKADLSNILSTISQHKKVILGSESDIKSGISEWNQILLEDMDTKSIKTLLSNRGITPAGSGTLKILQSFTEGVLGDKANIVGPLHNLYNLRIWATHFDAQSKYESTAIALGLNSTASALDVYKALLRHLLTFANNLKALL